MKLYYAPGACSMASHIVVNELKLPVELVRVDLGTKKTQSGADYRSVNPEGYVPALELDDGAVMTESAAILQYLADSAEPNSLLPPTGSLARYRVLELLAFISSEIHQGLAPLVNPAANDQLKAAAVAKVQTRVARLERLLGTEPYLTGNDFTVADAYAFAILGALRHFQVPIDAFPRVAAYQGRLGSRPAVVEMLRDEGLLQ